MQYHSFHPGKIWLDTNGNPIQAHGGSLFFENGIYYWYGENKEKTTGLDEIWHWGIRCYRSTDLYNWEDLGLIIPPEPENPDSSLHPSKCVDRPHIIYNQKTEKYVCWLKVMYPDQTQRFTILTANAFLGPYQTEREGFMPLDVSAGDFDLVVAADGQAYCYFERVHSELICADLTEDYLDVTGTFSSHFPHLGPPYVREAPAHFMHGGKHCLFTSGTTGYLPNPTEYAISDDWHGPFQVMGSPHPTDSSDTSFHSQISSVFQVPGKDNLYIACADRWLPEKMELSYSVYCRIFEALFHSNPDGNNPELRKEDIPETGPDNTSIATYVWLPIRFEGDMAYLDWKDEWRIEDYE